MKKIYEQALIKGTILEQVVMSLTNNDDVKNLAYNNDFEHFQIGLEKIVKKELLRVHTRNDELVTRYNSDIDFRESINQLIF